MRDAYGFGADIPIENRTLAECFREYIERSVLSYVLGEQMISDEENKQKLNAILTKAVGASKARKIIEFQDARSNFDEDAKTGKPGVNTNLVSTDFS